jgi:hypothetical protein
VAELPFSASDLAQTRFAVSPMWQVVTSVRLLAGSVSPAHRSWIRQVRPRLAAAGLDRGRLAELIPSSGFRPYFLNPAPAGSAPSLSAELAAIGAASPDRVRRDLDHREYHQGRLDPRLRSPHRDPPAGLARLTREIEAYWEPALSRTGHGSARRSTPTSSTAPGRSPNTARARSWTTCTPRCGGTAPRCTWSAAAGR